MFGLVPFKKENGMVKSRNPFLFDLFPEDFFSDSLFFPFYYRNSSYMNVDIKEDENSYILEADLPGIKKEDINIELQDDTLTISVKKEEKNEKSEENYIRKERKSCSVCRSFHLENIKNEEISAKFENGLLTMILPKKETGKKAESKKINID
jgi:HSP20 family protein